MQLAAVTEAFVMLKPGTGIAYLTIHWHHQAIDAQSAIFTVKLGAGMVAQHGSAEQEAVAPCSGIGGHKEIVMGKVVATRVLKSQLHMVQLRVGPDVHRQA